MILQIGKLNCYILFQSAIKWARIIIKNPFECALWGLKLKFFWKKFIFQTPRSTQSPLTRRLPSFHLHPALQVLLRVVRQLTCADTLR